MENTPIDQITGEPQRWEKGKSLSNRVYVEEQEGAVLGANAMFGHYILFDAQEHQIGIAKAKCSSIFGKWPPYSQNCCTRIANCNFKNFVKWQITYSS